MAQKYTYGAPGQDEGSITSGRLATEVLAAVSDLKGYAMQSWRDAALAELLTTGAIAGTGAAAAGKLTGTTLKSTVVSSSLTSLGTIAALVAGTGSFSSTLAVTSTSVFTGNVGIGSGASSQAIFVLETDNVATGFFRNSHASAPFGLVINYSADDPNGTGNEFLNLTDSSATRGTWRSNGGIANFQSNDADLSDARMKEMYGVIDGERAYNAILGLDIQTGRYLDNLDSREMVMVTAQQAAECESGWCAVDGWELKDGTTRHATNNKDIYFSHIRATQHLVGIVESNAEKIEALEAEIRRSKDA